MKGTPMSLAMKILLAFAAAFVVVVFVVPAAAKSWQVRWGATDAEVDATYPGDELLPDPDVVHTRAITIDASPEEVWPWIIQTGYKRGGWYTYDAFYKLTGSADFVDGGSSTRIVPELQGLKVGDKVHIAAPLAYTVVKMEKPYTMVWHGAGPVGQDMAGQAIDPKSAPEKCSSNTWVYVLEPLDGGARTRLILRQGYWTNDSTARLFSGGFFEFGGFVMARKHLLGVKARAEGRMK